jgi:hypothetical protein
MIKVRTCGGIVKLQFPVLIACVLVACQPPVVDYVTDPVVLDDVEHIAVGLLEVSDDVDCISWASAHTESESWACYFYGDSSIAMGDWSREYHEDEPVYRAYMDLDDASMEGVAVAGGGTFSVRSAFEPGTDEGVRAGLEATVMVDNARAYDLDIRVNEHRSGRIDVAGTVDGVRLTFTLEPDGTSTRGEQSEDYGDHDDCRTQVGIDCD